MFAIEVLTVYVPPVTVAMSPFAAPPAVGSPGYAPHAVEPGPTGEHDQADAAVQLVGPNGVDVYVAAPAGPVRATTIMPPPTRIVVTTHEIRTRAYEKPGFEWNMNSPGRA